MKEWIEKNIAPPGITKKNRGAVFSVIGKTFGVVKDDALKSFYAHFPYLSDGKKLAQHGKALFVPRLSHDSDDEYRKRVATASFYHARAGERSYNLEQLTEHFGSRYLLTEEFLQIYVKILDLNDEDRLWVMSFLDETLNPNISLTIADWFKFVENIAMYDRPAVAVVQKDRDVYPSGLRYDGRILHDHGREIFHDGTGRHSGAWAYSQFEPTEGTVSDLIRIPENYQGSRLYGGEIEHSGDALLLSPLAVAVPATYTSARADVLEARAAMSLEDRAEIDAYYDGRLLHEGIRYGEGQESIIDTTMALQVRNHWRFNGRAEHYCRPYEGLISYNGAAVYFDGRTYSGDQIQTEEVA